MRSSYHDNYVSIPTRKFLCLLCIYKTAYDQIEKWTNVLLITSRSLNVMSCRMLVTEDLKFSPCGDVCYFILTAEVAVYLISNIINSKQIIFNFCLNKKIGFNDNSWVANRPCIILDIKCFFAIILSNYKWILIDDVDN